MARSDQQMRVARKSWARSAAIRRLIEEHRTRFDELVAEEMEIRGFERVGYRWAEK